MPPEISERFSTHSLSGLIPENTVMILDHALRMLTQFQIAREACTIVEQQQFTPPQKWEVLCALIENFPYYCPFATLLSILLHCAGNTFGAVLSLVLLFLAR